MDDAARRTGPNGDRPDHGRLGPGSRHRSGVPQRGRPRRPGSGATAARGGVDRRFQPSAGPQRGTRDRSSRSPVRVMRQRPVTARPSEPGGRRELARHLAAGCQRTLVQGRWGKAGALRRRALGGGGVEPRRVVGGRSEVCGARGPDADGRPGRTAAACGLSASRSYGRARPPPLGTGELGAGPVGSSGVACRRPLRPARAAGRNVLALSARGARELRRSRGPGRW